MAQETLRKRFTFTFSKDTGELEPGTFESKTCIFILEQTHGVIWAALEFLIFLTFLKCNNLYLLIHFFLLFIFSPSKSMAQTKIYPMSLERILSPLDTMIYL
jgi:hypothetical protein